MDGNYLGATPIAPGYTEAKFVFVAADVALHAARKGGDSVVK